MFLKLLVRDMSVLGTSVFAITCAALLDLLTFVIKGGLRGGTHDRIVEAEDAATLHDVEIKAEAARLDSEAMLVEKRAIATARAVFDRKDRGALGAEELQIKAELMHFSAQIGGLLDQHDVIVERVQKSTTMIDAGRQAGRLDERVAQTFRKALFTVVEAFDGRLAVLKITVVPK